MSDLGNDVVSGFEIGQKAGGRLQGLNPAIQIILDRMKKKQDNQDDLGILGAKGLMEGKVQPATSTDKNTFSVPGIVDDKGNPVNLKSTDNSNTVYSQTIGPDGIPVLTPVAKIGKGSKIIKQPTGALSNKDLESAAQLLASGKEAPGQISGFSKQRQQIINRAIEINPNFDPQKAELSFKAGSSEMSNAKILGQKVNQANTLMATINGNYDSKTDTFNIPPSQHTEIAMGLAKLISPTGQVSENLTNQLQQGTLHQKLASVAIYFGADPSITSGPTQSLIKFLQKQVDIQGQSSQGMLDTYNKGSSPSYLPIRKVQPSTQQSGNNGQTSTGLTYTISQ